MEPALVCAALNESDETICRDKLLSSLHRISDQYPESCVGMDAASVIRLIREVAHERNIQMLQVEPEH